MAAKKPKAKPRPNSAALKVKGNANAKAKAKAKATNKAPHAKAKPLKQRSVQTAAAPPPPESVPAEQASTAETAALETKKGTFARLAGGVGNLFARMTGKKAPEPDEPPALSPGQAPAASPDQTIELAIGDILAVTEAPPPIPKPKS